MRIQNLVMIAACASCCVDVMAAAPKDLLDDVRAREAEILKKLSPHDRELAERLVASEKIPRIVADQPETQREGAWGEIERRESVTREHQELSAGRLVDASYSVVHQFQDFAVNEVVDGENMLIHGYRFWIEGVDTKDIANEEPVDLAGRIFEVVGTKQYATAVGGKRTVRHLKAIDVGPAKTAADEIRQLREYREWTDNAGKHKVLAKFMAFKNGKVEMKSLEGKPSSVPISRLSKADQKWVRDQVKARAAKPPRADSRAREGEGRARPAR